MLTGEASDEETFGYQEAWADYRMKPNRVSGLMEKQRNRNARFLALCRQLFNSADTVAGLDAGRKSRNCKNANRAR